MKPPVSPWRWVRAWALGGSAVALSTVGHTLGGGHVEPVLLVLLTIGAALAAYGWLRNERGLVAIVAAVAVMQGASHLLLGAGHAHDSSSAMLAGHLLAGLLLAVLLRRGESRIFAAARRRYLQWQIAVRAALAGLPALQVWHQGLIGGNDPAVKTWIHRAAQGRAPPVTAFC